MTEPIIIVHRRNRSDQLSGLPAGCWVEIDVDLHDGMPVLSHDHFGLNEAELLDTYLLRAILRGISGFIFDCKRENVEAVIAPLLAAHNIADYFYLNEMEIMADMFLENTNSHRTAVRVWQYRGAATVVRYAADMKAARQNFPQWVWADCWKRGLKQDINKLHVPLRKNDAKSLQDAGIKICLCSPELYAHDYGQTYDKDELQAIYRGVVKYRQTLNDSGATYDGVCTKFPWLWSRALDSLSGTQDLSA